MDREFGSVLARKRKAAGLSQTALAEQVGISPSHLNRIEKGERNPPPADKVLRIANVLRLSPAETDQLLMAAGYAPWYNRQLPSSSPQPDASPEVRALIRDVTVAILSAAEDPDLTPAQREDVIRILRTLDLPAMIARVRGAVPGISIQEATKNTVPAVLPVPVEDAEALWRDYQRKTLEDVQRQAGSPSTLWPPWQSGKA